MVRCLCRLQRWRRHLCYFYSVGDTVALCPSLLTKTLSWVTPCCLYCLMQFLWDKFREGELRDWGDVSEPELLASHNGASTEGAASHDVFLQQQRTKACSVLAATAGRGQRWVPRDFWSQMFQFGETRGYFEVPTIVKNSNCFKRDIHKVPWQFLGRSAFFHLGKSGRLSGRRELSVKKQVGELPWWSSGWESAFLMAGSLVQSLVKGLDLVCCN